MSNGAALQARNLNFDEVVRSVVAKPAGPLRGRPTEHRSRQDGCVPPRLIGRESGKAPAFSRPP
jgi:hypothetical protein